MDFKFTEFLLTKGVNSGYNIVGSEAVFVDRTEQLERIEALTKEIASLPKGYLSKKTIGGNIYYYHQWSEKGIKQSRYLHDEEIHALAKQINQRKALQERLRSLKAEPQTIQPSERRNEVTNLKCTFMHKNTAVAEIEIDEATGFVQKINEVFAPEHLPLGIPVVKGRADRAAFNDWWADRSIPASRSGVREALEALEISNTKTLLVRCYGLSLSDQYWICPAGSGLEWAEINFFDHDFSDDVGDILFGENKKKDVLNFSSPDNTSDGNLKKRWKIVDGKRCLVKGGSNPFRQQPFNEVIATGIMQRLGIPHVPYTVIWDQGAPYSVCEDFVSKDTELIPAWRILQSQKRSNNTSVYRHFVNCCEALGIKDVVPALDRMIVLDYIIANEDRHFNNFGALRNAETLEWLGMAPIYDSGSSLGYDRLPAQMHSEQNVICKPFKKHHEEQLKLVSSFDWIDFEQLTDIEELIAETFSGDGVADYIDDARIKAITTGVQRRIENLKQLAQSHTPAGEDTTEDDVAENIAEKYTK